MSATYELNDFTFVRNTKTLVTEASEFFGKISGGKSTPDFFFVQGATKRLMFEYVKAEGTNVFPYKIEAWIYRNTDTGITVKIYND